MINLKINFLNIFSRYLNFCTFCNAIIEFYEDETETSLYIYLQMLQIIFSKIITNLSLKSRAVLYIMTKWKYYLFFLDY